MATQAFTMADVQYILCRFKPYLFVLILLSTQAVFYLKHQNGKKEGVVKNSQNYPHLYDNLYAQLEQRRRFQLSNESLREENSQDNLAEDNGVLANKKPTSLLQRDHKSIESHFSEAEFLSETFRNLPSSDIQRYQNRFLSGWDEISPPPFSPRISSTMPPLLSEQYVRNLFTFENVPFIHYELNASKAQQMALSPTVPEPRSAICQNRTYPGIDHVTVSIIIPFHNELWVVLVRCIYSILNRTPTHLHEVILIDDASTEPNLGKPLEEFVSLIPKVKLLKTVTREGLIRARMLGARIATGDVLVFMDAHIECNTGWLPPLLHLIQREPSTIAIPVIDSINPATLAYRQPTYTTWGTFSWELDFVWRDGEELFKERSDPFNTVTMIGCGFAINKQSFFDFGGYDEGMNIWGGENLEISFRTWLCGGALKIVPCSHIGHIFRARLPYLFSDNVMYRNLQRLAQVWLGPYGQLYFQTTGIKFTFSYEENHSLYKRYLLRKRLKCKPFAWLLKYLAPEIVIPSKNVTSFGQLKNVGSCNCLTRSGETNVGFQYCSFHDAKDKFLFTETSRNIEHSSGRCLTVCRRNEVRNSTTAVPPGVVLQNCDASSSQMWSFQETNRTRFVSILKGVDLRKPVGMLVWQNTSLCLTQDRGVNLCC